MSNPDVIATLQELGFNGGQRFSLAVKVDGELVPACFTDLERAAEWIEEKGAVDCYVCGNEVREGCTAKPTEDDVVGHRWLLVDVDPKKDDRDPNGTSQARRDAASEVAAQVFEHFNAGILVDSGRGAQCWLSVEPGVPRRDLLAWIREEFGNGHVEVDATFERSRLMRLPGTVNSRTGDDVWIVDVAHNTVTREDVTETLKGWHSTATTEVPEADTSEPSRRDVKRWVRGELLAMWRQDPMEITQDRSRRDFLFLLGLLRAGCPIDAASRLLHALPGGKAAERVNDGGTYWASTAGSALRKLGEDQERTTTLEGLIDALRRDPTLILERNAVKALAWVRTHDLAEWLRLRAEIKPLVRSANISIADVEKLILNEISRQNEGEESDPRDDLVAYVRPAEGGRGAWKVCDAHGGWSWVTLHEAQTYLSGLGQDPEVEIARCMRHPFTVCLEPFKARTLPGRRWNESDARFVVEPEAGPHPTWDQLYRVVGRGMDHDVKASTWCRDNGIETGGDYLRVWVSTALQDPRSRRAYLFLYSTIQGTGKSLFFESLKYLIGGAVADGKNALQSDRGFNGELRNAVIAYTEEVNLAAGTGRSSLYNRLKDWTLCLEMLFEVKGATPFSLPNVLSWGQCANDPSYCPVFEGDDRITVIEVLPPLDSERMTKADMQAKLIAEAPAFLHTLLNAATPGSKGRYVVPPLSTQAKERQARASRDDFQVWRAQHPEWILMTDGDLVDTFRDWLAARDLGRQYWPPQRILRACPSEEDAARRLWVDTLSALVEEADLTSTEAAERFGISSARAAGRLLTLLSGATDRVDRRTSRGVSRYRISAAI